MCTLKEIQNKKNARVTKETFLLLDPSFAISKYGIFPVSVCSTYIQAWCSSLQILSLLTQFSGLTTLQSLVSGEALQGASPNLVLSLRSDNITYNLFFFFFEIPTLHGGFVNLDIVFGCDPTYNPSSVQKFSLLTQFSGLTTLQSLVVSV